jgi:hypothetical protein
MLHLAKSRIAAPKGLRRYFSGLCALPQEECYWIQLLPHLNCYR